MGKDKEQKMRTIFNWLAKETTEEFADTIEFFINPIGVIRRLNK